MRVRENFIQFNRSTASEREYEEFRLSLPATFSIDFLADSSQSLKGDRNRTRVHLKYKRDTVNSFQLHSPAILLSHLSRSKSGEYILLITF